MQALLLGVLIKLFQSKPVQDKLAEWKTDLFAWLNEQKTELFAWLKSTIENELKTWVPIFMRTIVTTIAQSAGQFVVDTENKVTKVIPGQVDDQVVEQIVNPVLTKLGDLFGVKLF